MIQVRFDSIGGASGNMILGALAGLGVELDGLRGRLAALGIEDFAFESREVSRHGFAGLHVEVRTPADRHHARHLSDIRGIIEASDLPPRTKTLSLRVFERLARAEATVHGSTPEDVHFHEVGALDAIVDITGACLALELLGVAAVTVGPLPIGTGTVSAAHGTMPVPVPAVVELLKGRTVVQTDERAELVTPTGAALLTTWQDELAPADTDAPLRMRASACGFGTRELAGRPNALRATLLESDAGEEAAAPTRCLVLECNLDDTAPELIGALTVHLLELGALDVFTTPVHMKKQRPGVVLTVLCRHADRAAMIDAVFTGTTTFGIREHAASRTVLERRHVEVETPFGMVRVKVGTWRGRPITHAPEHDDCVRLAAEKGVPVREVYEAAVRACPSSSSFPPSRAIA
jgi:uncharacterized protein (TIGR00299 family) protein